VIVAVLLMIVFGSVRTGLIGMIPNIAPGIFVGGYLGFSNIPLDMMTATLIPMIIGLSVDDTIHFINHGHV
jgi:predicted RND superfamily exporter protein